jgi:hypothetical protein
MSEAEDIEDLAQLIASQALRIEALEAALKEAGEMWVRKDNRIEQLEAALRATAKAVESLAFKMPPPNPYTPQFVMIAHTAHAALAPESDK